MRGVLGGPRGSGSDGNNGRAGSNEKRCRRKIILQGTKRAVLCFCKQEHSPFCDVCARGVGKAGVWCARLATAPAWCVRVAGRLEVLGFQLEEALRVHANGAQLRRFLAHYHVSAVAAHPDAVAVA